MLQSYKLRLGDGTVLVVDHDGLSTWLADRRAMVQLVGSNHWKPLKEFLAQERAAARRAARQQPKPLSTSRDALPLVYPKPLEPSAASPSSDPAAPPSGTEAPEGTVPAQPPAGAGGGHAAAIPVRADGLPLIPPPPKPQEAKARPGPAPIPPPTARPSIAKPPEPQPSPAKATLRKPRGEVRPGPSAPRATVVRPSLPKPAAAPVPAKQADPVERPAAPVVVPAEVLPAQVVPEQAEQPAIFSSESAALPPPPDEDVGWMGLPKPLDDAPFASAVSWPDPLDTPAPSAAPVASLPHTPEPPRPPSRPSLQVLAEDPAAERARRTRPTSTPDDEMAIIPLKPLEDEPPPPVRQAPATDAQEPGQIFEETPRRSAIQKALLQGLSRAMSAYDTLLTGWIESLARRDWQGTRLRLVSRASSAYDAVLARWKTLARPAPPLPSVSSDEPAPSRAADGERSGPAEPPPAHDLLSEVRVLAEEGLGSPAGNGPRRSADEAPPILRLKPLEDEVPMGAASKDPVPNDGAPAWVEGLIGSVARLARPDRSPSVPPHDPTAPSAARPAGLESREVVKPPLPMRELPVLRFKDIPEPEEVGDVYEGERFLEATWRWTKRIVLIGGLVGGGLLAALHWETWSPKAARIGRMALTELDRLKQSMDHAERQRQAREQAREQLPHLAPETIRLVLAKSATGVLDPPEMFQVTSDAADRGLSVLTPGEAQELNALRRELFDALLPSERERILDYDDARTRRATFPFENRAALELFARGAYSLPSRSRERLQELVGKAVAAGLRSEVPPPPAAER